MTTQDTIVRLKILSQTKSPEMITEALGLQCDKSWRTGDNRKHTAIIELNNGWILHSGLARAASLDAHIEAMMVALTPVKDIIKSLSATETVELSVVVYSSSAPALNFSSSMISQIAEIGAGIDIDLFIM